MSETQTVRVPTLTTVNALCEAYPAVCRKGGVRAQIFYSRTNGLEASGALVRAGRRVLIDVEKYFQWLLGGAK